MPDCRMWSTNRQPNTASRTSMADGTLPRQCRMLYDTSLTLASAPLDADLACMHITRLRGAAHQQQPEQDHRLGMCGCACIDSTCLA